MPVSSSRGSYEATSVCCRCPVSSKNGTAPSFSKIAWAFLSGSVAASGSPRAISGEDKRRDQDLKIADLVGQSN
jgi:hypothetical protein